MDKYHLWPETVDGDGVRANLHILTDYRNKIIHGSVIGCKQFVW